MTIEPTGEMTSSLQPESRLPERQKAMTVGKGQVETSRDPDPKGAMPGSPGETAPTDLSSMGLHGQPKPATENAEGDSDEDQWELDPETLSVMAMLDEVARKAALEAAAVSQPSGTEVILTDGQGDRIEHLGQRTLTGVQDIAEFLNPLRDKGGTAAKPDAILAITQTLAVVLKEVVTQRRMVGEMRKLLAEHTRLLTAVSIDTNIAVGVLRPEKWAKPES